MKLIDWSLKLIPLRAEADELRLTLKRLHSIRKEMDRQDYLDHLTFWNNELRLVHRQMYDLIKYKPIFIEDEII